MQISTNTFEQQGASTQQLRFVPVSSNVSCVGTTFNYGIGTHTGINAFSNNSQMVGDCTIRPQGSYINASMGTAEPCILASQLGQMGSGVFSNMSYNNQITRNIMVQPTIDISETSSDIMISAYVSNSAVNDLKLNVSDDSLTISGTLLSGINQFVLNRTIPLSTSVRAEAVEATLQSGVVEIRLPKAEKFNRASHTAGNIMMNK